MTRFATALAICTTVLAFTPAPLTARSTGQAAETAARAQNQPRAAQVDVARDAGETRDRLREVLSRYPRNVGRVLRLDPTLLQDPDYLAGYPALAEFIAAHPEIARNPEFFLEGYSVYYEDNRTASVRAVDAFGNFLEGLAIFLIMLTVATVLFWIIRAIVDHRRWLRVSKVQTEVHTKLLDRFSSSDELLAYMRTPAGTRFLESAPILLDDRAARGVSAPLNRILLSVQAGVVMVLAGIGVLLGRTQLMFEEVRTMMYLLGVFGIFVGLGFVLSAFVSYTLSRRMGLIGEGTAAGPAPSRGGQGDSTVE